MSVWSRDAARRVVGVGKEQCLDRPLAAGERRFEAIDVEPEPVRARAIDGNEVELVSRLEVRPEPRIARGRHEHGVARVGQGVESGLQDRSRPGEHRDLGRVEAAPEKALRHERRQPLAKFGVAHHRVVAEDAFRRRRQP